MLSTTTKFNLKESGEEALRILNFYSSRAVQVRGLITFVDLHAFNTTQTGPGGVQPLEESLTVIRSCPLKTSGIFLHIFRRLVCLGFSYINYCGV